MFLTFDTWVVHDRSEEMQTPRYLKVVTLSKSEWLSFSETVGMGGCCFLDMTLYLVGLCDR